MRMLKSLGLVVLFAVSFAVSRAPDTNVIDRGGNYGPSTQQYMQAATAITLGVGLPALGVGLLTKARTGDEVVTQRAEQVVSQKDVRCNERPATGAMSPARCARPWLAKNIFIISPGNGPPPSNRCSACASTSDQAASSVSATNR